MKKTLVALALVGIILILSTPITKKTPQDKAVHKPTLPAATATPWIASKEHETVKSIFVPDWSLLEETILHNGYDRWIYFGGKDKLPVFESALRDKNLWITIKVDSLEDLNKTNLREYELNKIKGIVLDLEINGIGTDKLIHGINEGVKELYGQAKDLDMQFAVAMYGDLFYRKRPYDLKTINMYSDEIMIMAYDYSKSYGEPGGNYPFKGFKEMIDNYLKVVPPEKITVVFGMYGYDWTMKEGKPLKNADSISLAEIKNRFLGKKCYEINCRIASDDVSKEKKVTYSDGNGYDHIVHFEDDDSVLVKSEFMKAKGITSTAFWAWGYF
ncbi:MAG: glycosyl hydrolase family 18 protein [Patescibacteria group bacterium]